MQLTYRYRLYPSEVQKVYMAKQFGCNRFVYNHLLHQCKERTIKPNLELVYAITGLRQEYPFLTEVSAVALQQSARDLINAFQNFFARRTRHPTFRSKHDNNQSFRLVGKSDTFGVRQGRLHLARCPGLVRMVIDRVMPSEPSSVTITRSPSGQYHACFVCEVEPTYLSDNGEVLGIDLGLKDLVVTSDGEVYGNPRHLQRSTHRLTRLQRRLSKSKKGSQNRQKARIKVAQCHRRVANQRKDYLHQISTNIIRENQTVVLEDLQVSNMVKNRYLAKAISSAAWRMFREMLMYKARKYDRAIFITDQWTPSTQTCHGCLHPSPVKLTLKERVWTCPTCGMVHDRDVNAAKVLQVIGYQHLARLTSRPSPLSLLGPWREGKFLPV